MTELKLENLVLDGVRVVNGNVIGLVRLAFQPAGPGYPAIVPSAKRHLLLSTAASESDTRPRYLAIHHGGNNAPRAGRLAVPAGVPNCRIAPTPGGRVCLTAIPAPKITQLLRSELAAQPLRQLSGRQGRGFGQRSFTHTLATKSWRKPATRMPGGGR